MSNLNYNLDDLFHNTPVFAEPVIQFSSAHVDPYDDALLLTRIQRGTTDCKAFNAQVERLNHELKQEEKNKATMTEQHWKKAMTMSCKAVANEANNRKNQYDAQQKLMDLRKTNMPFFYIKGDHVKNLRELQKRTTHKQIRNEIGENLRDYENLMQQYKNMNPHLFK